MSSVVDFSAHQRAVADTTLVLVDMQREHPSFESTSEADTAINNCRKALAHARMRRFQVAFTRWNSLGTYLQPQKPRDSWIDGFSPNRSDLVFERDRPSCYSSPWFEEAISQASNRFVLAGFSGEVACLATVIDAFHRNHLVTFLIDASASGHLDGVHAFDVHRVVAGVSHLFGEIVTTSDWIARTSQNTISVD